MFYTIDSKRFLFYLDTKIVKITWLIIFLKSCHLFFWGCQHVIRFIFIICRESSWDERRKSGENESITLKKKVLRFLNFQQNLQGLPREAFVIHKSLKFIPAVKKKKKSLGRRNVTKPKNIKLYSYIFSQVHRFYNSSQLNSEFSLRSKTRHKKSHFT